MAIQKKSIANLEDVEMTQDELASLITTTAFKTKIGGKDYDIDKSTVDKITKQILGQGTTSKWKGEGFGSAEKNAAEMAKQLAASGVTDINQVGMVDKKVDVAVQPIFESVDTGGYDENGPIIIQKIVGYTDAQGNKVDASLVKTETDYGGESGNMTTTNLAPNATETDSTGLKRNSRTVTHFGDKKMSPGTSPGASAILLLFAAVEKPLGKNTSP
jgi:hypothetical protein